MDGRTRDRAAPIFVVGGALGGPVAGFAFGVGVGLLVFFAGLAMAGGSRLLTFFEVRDRRRSVHALAEHALEANAEIDIASSDSHGGLKVRVRGGRKEESNA